MKLIDHKDAAQVTAANNDARYKEFYAVVDVKKGDILSWNAFNWGGFGSPVGDQGSNISGFLQSVGPAGDPYFSGWQRNTDYYAELSAPIVRRHIIGTDKDMACFHGIATSINGGADVPGGGDAIIAGWAGLTSGDHATAGYFPNNSESLDVTQLRGINNTRFAMAYWDGDRAQMVISAYSPNSRPLFKPKISTLTSARPDGYTKGNKRIAALSDGGFVVFGEAPPSKYAGYTVYVFERYSADFKSLGIFTIGGYPWRNSSYGSHSFTARVSSNDTIVSAFITTGTTSTYGNANLHYSVTKADGTVIVSDANIPLPSSMRITASSHQSITYSTDNSLALITAIVTLTDNNAYVICGIVNVATGALVANTSNSMTGAAYYVNREYAASTGPIRNSGFLVAYTDTPFAIKYIHYDNGLVVKGTFSATAAAGSGGIHLGKFVQSSVKSFLQFSYCDSTNVYYLGNHVINTSGTVAALEWLDDAVTTGAISAGQTTMHKALIAPSDRPPQGTSFASESTNMYGANYESFIYVMSTVTANGKSGYFSSALCYLSYSYGAMCIGSNPQSTNIPLWSASDILFVDYLNNGYQSGLAHLIRQRAWNNLQDAIYLFSYTICGHHVPVGVAAHDAAAGEKVIGQISGTATLRIPFSRRFFIKSSDLAYPGLDMIISGNKCQILDSAKAASLPSTPSIYNLAQ